MGYSHCFNDVLELQKCMQIAKEWNAVSLNVHDALMQNQTGRYDTGLLQAPALF